MIKKIKGIYFTGTGTTKKIVETVAKEAKATMEELLCYKEGQIALELIDLSLPNARVEPIIGDEETLIFFGMPVIAGRLPNLIVKELKIIGNGAKSVPIVLYGNRDYQDALSELNDFLKDNGCITIGAAAFIGEHSFSEILAKGRPDKEDLKIGKKFGTQIAKNVIENQSFKNWGIIGNPKPYFGYYRPEKADGTPIDIRKVKPVTNSNCTGCLKCSKGCRMGAILENDPKDTPGICMKCCYCIKGCPVNAKEFADEGFVYHKEDLERKYIERKEPDIFL